MENDVIYFLTQMDIFERKYMKGEGVSRGHSSFNSHSLLSVQNGIPFPKVSKAQGYRTAGAPYLEYAEPCLVIAIQSKADTWHMDTLAVRHVSGVNYTHLHTIMGNHWKNAVVGKWQVVKIATINP